MPADTAPDVTVGAKVARDQSEEEDGLTYEDADAQRWMALAELGEQVAQTVEPGSMRLTGNFQGVATTHTHQLDLAVIGFDIEMPSQVAEQAMRQLAAHSRNGSPLLDHRLISGAEVVPEFAPRRLSLFSSLANFFSRDARDARQASQDATHAPVLALPDLQMPPQDNAGTDNSGVLELQAERDRFAVDLELVRNQLAELADKYADSLAQLEAARRKQETQVAHIEGLRRQAELELQSRNELSSQLNQREGALREFELRSAGAVQQNEATLQENAALKEELWDLQERAAALDCEVAALSARAAAGGETDAQEGAAEQLRAFEEQLCGLAAERDEARWQADSAEARIAELELQVGTLLQQTAEVHALHDEACRELENRTGELEQQTQEALELRTLLSKLHATERQLQVQLDVAHMQLRDSAAAVRDAPLLEQGQPGALHAELHEARAVAAAALEARIASDAQAAEVRASAEQLRKEHKELMVRVKQLTSAEAAREAEAKALGRELQSAQARLEARAVESCRMAGELKKHQVHARSEEKSAAEARTQQQAALEALADARTEALELRVRREAAAAQAATAATAAERRLEAALREAGNQSHRAQLALSERDQARQEFREAQLDGLGETALLREELIQARDEAARVLDLEDELKRMRRRCAGLEAARTALAHEASVVSTPAAAGAPVLLQDRSATCLIRSVRSLTRLGSGGSLGMPLPGSPNPSYRPQVHMGASTTVPVPSMPGRKIGKVTHIGTSIGPQRATSVCLTPAQPLSPTGAFGGGVSLGPTSPVRTASGLSPRAVTAFSVAAPTGFVFPTGLSRPVVHLATPAGPIRATMTVQVLRARRIQH